MQIPFLNLKPNEKLQLELNQAFIRVMNSGIYLNGLEGEKFAYDWAKYCDKKYCILVASGLDGLKLCLRYGMLTTVISKDVFLPSIGCVQTWMAVTRLNLYPVVDEDDFYETAIKVHLYGALDSTSPSGFVIDDCCQAHGLKGVGDPAVYSFYPTKNLGGLGDGGAIVTDNEDLYLWLTSQINHSALRMDEVQAAVLSTKLPYLDQWNDRRKRNADIYLANLKNVTLPTNLNSVWHQFVIQYDKRDWLRNELSKRGIETIIHYPKPPHQMLGYRMNLPLADDWASSVLSLPIAPHLNDEHIEYICEAVNSIIDGV